MIGLRPMDLRSIRDLTMLLDGRSFGDYFTFVEQLALADVGTMTYMHFAGGAVLA